MRSDSDFSAEIQAHIALEADRLRGEGLSEADALAAARRSFGNPTAAQEKFYWSRRSLWWDDLRKDLRYAFRTLSKSPAFTMAAVLTLALGIGANTAMFSLIDAVLLKPLPFPNADRLVAVHTRDRAGDEGSFSPADYLDLQRQASSFENLAAYREWNFNLRGRDHPEKVDGAVVTPRFFAIFGTPAEVGRTLNVAQDKPGQGRSAVMSDALWRRKYGADPALVGASIDVNGEPCTIVGIMPPAFQFPSGSQLWITARYAAPEHPLRPTRDPSSSRDSHYFDVVGSLAPGVTRAAGQAEAETIVRRLKQRYRDDEEAVGASLVDLHQDLIGQSRSALLLLLGSVGLLLLIACSNVANLLLARGSTRQREIAIRGALGAGRLRLARQLLTESIVLAGAGAVLGILLARCTLTPLEVLMPPDMLANGSKLHLNLQVLIFTALSSLGAAVLFGLFPAWQAVRTDLNAVIQDGARGATGGSRSSRTRSFLVVSEIALATVLLIGAGLLIRTFNRLLSVQRGFTSERILSLEISLPQTRYPAKQDRARFVNQVLERIKAIPYIDSAGAISRLPLGRGASTRSVEVKGRTPSPGSDPDPDYLVITPDYFRTMAIPLLKGRAFTDRDSAASPTVAIVNAAMAKYFWPGQDAVGKLIKVVVGEKNWTPVIGVVGDVVQRRLDQAPRPAVYIAYAQDTWPALSFVTSTEMPDPISAAPAIESAIHAVDKDEPVYNVRSMRQVISASLSSRRARMLLLGLFAFIALMLACIGIYGVIAYSVAQRSHEIGIRVALGAKSSDILQSVVAQGLRLALAGVAVGLLLSLALAHLLSSVLFGVRPNDAGTFTASAVILIAVALAASYFPARRAAHLDPVQALRAE